MSDALAQQLEQIRLEMAEKFGAKPCKIECTVNEAIAMRLTIQLALEQGPDEFMKKLLEMAIGRIQRGLDDVK
jgi:hypothetical protein